MRDNLAGLDLDFKFVGGPKGQPTWTPPKTPLGLLFERPWIHVLGRNAAQNSQNPDEPPGWACNLENLD